MTAAKASWYNSRPLKVSELISRRDIGLVHVYMGRRLNDSAPTSL